MKKNIRSRQALRGGSYSLVLTAVVLAILIAVNLFASALPTTLTKLDISSGKLYSVTSNTKAVVNNLQQDVTIYWVVQADKEDSILENLLGKYESLSSHIDVVKKNPDIFPTFTESYTDEDVPNNSLIVESGDRFRYVSFNDIYETEPDYYSYTYSVTGFDGEGALTSAIDYVVTEDLPKLYLLEGHGEAALPDTFADSVDKANITTAALSLLTVDAVPDDADALMIFAPQTDISEEEASMLSDYTAGGGKLFVISGPVKGATLTHLESLLAEHGVSAVEGIAIEGSRDHYAGYPYVLLPDLQSSTITAPLTEDSYYALVPLAKGLDVSGASANVTALMTTSDAAYSKVAGYDLTTYEKEDGDIDGPFALGVSIETDGAGQLVWFSTTELFLDDGYNAYSSGANNDLAMNALSALIGEREALAIRSKSLNYNYLTISESTSATLKALMIGVFPLAYLGIGAVVILRKRGKQNGTV